MQVCNQTFTPEIIERIQGFIDSDPAISRTRLSFEVCRWLDWRSPNGKLKGMSCRVALLRLHERGLIILPKAREKPPRRSKQVSQHSSYIEELSSIDCNLDDIRPLEVIKIENNKEASYVWDSLMDRYHYLGSGPLCGAQIRYLIHSERYGYLGGFAFSAAAWRLEVRDHFIGWDEASIKRHLDQVVCNSRFLILPQVKVKNLASYVLSLCIKRLPNDWYDLYGIEPVLLETFVEQSRFKGTCYQASNWIYVGTTKGRGRQDKENNYGLSIKDVYVYPLRANFQEVLCDGFQGLSPTRREPVDWAEEEFGGVNLGDERRSKRLMTIARDFYANPKANIPQACESRAKTKAAYRFFDDTRHTMAKILSPHYQSTLNRVGREKIVLAVQDTTTLNYSAHPLTENFGPINNKEDTLIGLILHDTMAFSLDGTPLGLLDVQCWARPPEEAGKRKISYKLPIEEKESNKWLESIRAQAEIQKQCPDTMIVNVSDRESDIYEMFSLALNEPDGPQLLVRARYNRTIVNEQNLLWDHVSKQKLSGICHIQVPRKKNKPSRQARLEIRFSKVTLKPPTNKPRLKQLTLWAILAEETDPPDDVEPLKWMLLTTCEIDTFEQATEKLDWYCGRWGIEIYHRTLKSGCKIEERQLGNADRIEACLAIDMVVAWRIYHLTKLGRETPNVPCTAFFEDAEWKALVAYKTQNPIPPDKPPTLREATRMVASLGGFLGRKGDGEPGTKTLWLGLQRLDDLTAMWKTCISILAPDFLIRPP